MTNSMVKQESFAVNLVSFAKVSAYFTEDLSKALLGFIPNGLNLIYDFVLKNLPGVGHFFSHRWVEQVLKLCTGITIGRGLAEDIAHYLFRPLGFAIGIFIGTIRQPRLTYQGQVGKLLYRLSGQTVGGALVALMLFVMTTPWLGAKGSYLNVNTYCWVAVLGGLVGLLAKALLLIAINSVNATNAAIIQKNVNRAKDLNGKLKQAAKQRVKSLILMQAQDIIQQMNGPQSQQYLEEFFEQEFATVAMSAYQKIDRHFNYLTDRACHGDLKALKRMQELIPKFSHHHSDKNSLDTVIERIFNARAIFKLKDEVDTIYDRWQYRYLSVAITPECNDLNSLE